MNVCVRIPLVLFEQLRLVLLSIGFFYSMPLSDCLSLCPPAAYPIAYYASSCCFFLCLFLCLLCLFLLPIRLPAMPLPVAYSFSCLPVAYFLPNACSSASYAFSSASIPFPVMHILCLIPDAYLFAYCLLCLSLCLYSLAYCLFLCQLPIPLPAMPLCLFCLPTTCSSGCYSYSYAFFVFLCLFPNVFKIKKCIFARAAVC